MLSVEDVSVRFDGVAALARVSLRAGRGECLGLVGPNGAGKTTLLDVLGGLVRPAAGRIVFLGRSLGGLAPQEIALAGVGRTFQSPRLFTRMSVAENLRAARALDPGPWLEWARLETRRDELAVALTPAEARRLELARALAARPALLLLDEPCGGLTPPETEAMAGLLREAAAPDRITILVEHKLGVIGRLCRRVVVLHLGEKIYDGPVDALRGDPRVIAAYLGAPTV
jgi:branched-chain amino acid transport system ATP-binding protein